jgi:trehalose-6-phosphatase
MDLTGIVNAARSWHEAIMPDTGVITRAGARTLNQTTGLYEQTPTAVYTGICKLVLPKQFPNDSAAVGQVLVESRPRLDLPVLASADARDGDIFECLTSGDPALVGLKWKLKGISAQSQTSARRFWLEANT